MSRDHYSSDDYLRVIAGHLERLADATERIADRLDAASEYTGYLPGETPGERHERLHKERVWKS